MRTDVIDFHCLVADWPTLRDKLVQRNWLVEEPAGSGNYRVRGDLHFVYLGPVVLTPATYDADGNVITEAVMDTVDRCYLRLYGDNKLAEETGPRTDADGNPISALYWTKLGGEIRANGTWDDVRKGYGIKVQGTTRFWVLDETLIVPTHEWQ